VQFIPFVPALERPTALEVVRRAERTLAELESLWDLLRVDEEPPSPFALPSDLRVSVVIPVYNEKKTVFDVIARVKALPFETEIIVVDDCSTDGTRGWLETIRGAPGLKLILKDQNEGKGAALRSGFAAATGQVVVVQDADLEYDPRDIENLIRPIVSGEADVSYGSRYLYRRSNDRSLAASSGEPRVTTASNLFTRPAADRHGDLPQGLSNRRHSRPAAETKPFRLRAGSHRKAGAPQISGDRNAEQLQTSQLRGREEDWHPRRLERDLLHRAIWAGRLAARSHQRSKRVVNGVISGKGRTNIRC